MQKDFQKFPPPIPGFPLTGPVKSKSSWERSGEVWSLYFCGQRYRCGITYTSDIWGICFIRIVPCVKAATREVLVGGISPISGTLGKRVHARIIEVLKLCSHPILLQALCKRKPRLNLGTFLKRNHSAPGFVLAHTGPSGI